MTITSAFIRKKVKEYLDRGGSILVIPTVHDTVDRSTTLIAKPRDTHWITDGASFMVSTLDSIRHKRTIVKDFRVQPPTLVFVLMRIVGIELLDVQVLLILPGYGHAPGTALVVADDHARHAWE